jgi:heat shock protein HslJ
MKLYTRFAAALAALALLTVVAGCGPMAASDIVGEPVNLDGTSWTLVRLQGQDLIPETQATLAFEGEQIAGTASCNHYFGSVTIKGETLTVGTVGNTEMWCAAPEGVMDQEMAYLKALGSVARYNVENGELTLYDADDQALLVFASETN